MPDNPSVLKVGNEQEVVMFSHLKRPLISQLAAGIVVVVSCAATPVLADTPQAVTIVTQLTFYPDTTIGTFEATGPICASGTVTTVNLVDVHIGEGPAAFNVNARALFVCDDNSGSFVIRLHPQGNARPKDGFTFNGPWAIVGNTATGAYKTLSGHGEFGVVVDFSVEPLTGSETYVGFVTLK
jgi:hypothetical protein